MKPISAWCFVKENRGRCALLAFMFVLTYLAYIGGLYATNIQASFDYHIEDMKKYATIGPNAADNDFSQFYDALEKLEKDSNIRLIKQGVISSVTIKSVMGFRNVYDQFAFNSVADFKTFCEHRGVNCDFDSLKPGHVIMTQMAANNRGMKLGDKLTGTEEDAILHEYTLGAITDEIGYFIYYINESENLNYIVLPVDMSEEEFARYTCELSEKYDINVVDRAVAMDSIESQLNGLNVIYTFIVIFVAVIMAVTVNAAFVGMYQHRKPEFAIYRAIGIGKWQVIRKIVGELLLIDIIGMAAGGAFIAIVLYLLNELVLYGQGMQLYYYHPFALMGLLVCNLAVLVPMMLTRCRQLLRADICEY